MRARKEVDGERNRLRIEWKEKSGVIVWRMGKGEEWDRGESGKIERERERIGRGVLKVGGCKRIRRCGGSGKEVRDRGLERERRIGGGKE